MFKKITALLLIAAGLFSFTACNKKETEEKKSHIVDNEPSVTLAPAATAAPDSAQKASEKLGDGDANAIVSENGEERKVDLGFNLANQTGIDFVALLLAPVSEDLAEGIKSGKIANQLPKDYVFKNGTMINAQPPALSGDGDTVVATTLFNIAAIDSNGTGYVFQNIDLSTSSQIVMSLENGVPKAVIN